MMRKLIAVAVVVLMVSAFGLAGEKPAPEVFGGYQFTSTDGGWHASGWNGAANMYITRWFGATGDFSGVYSSGSNLYTYTFGPVVSKRKGKFSLGALWRLRRLIVREQPPTVVAVNLYQAIYVMLACLFLMLTKNCKRIHDFFMSSLWPQL